MNTVAPMRILLIEDDKSFSDTIAEMLELLGYEVVRITALPASPEDEGFQQLVREAGKFDLMIVDEDSITPLGRFKASLGYIQALRENFLGPMIAYSGQATNRLLQVFAGCDDGIRGKNIPKLVKVVEELLPITA